jgi:hypothetical protein
MYVGVENVLVCDAIVEERGEEALLQDHLPTINVLNGYGAMYFVVFYIISIMSFTQWKMPGIYF